MAFTEKDLKPSSAKSGRKKNFRMNARFEAQLKEMNIRGRLKPDQNIPAEVRQL